MDAKIRRKLEMGKRVLEWSRAHPDGSPGHAAALARLEDRLQRADRLATQQREGMVQVRMATLRKRDLRREIRRVHLAHLASVAEMASREVPDLSQKFVLPSKVNTYLAFRTAARAMAAEAESRKELLVRHGLSEPVLEALKRDLDQFEAAVEDGASARVSHVGASAELDEVADEVVQIVKVMDGLTRFHFRGQPELLAAWESASNVIATPRAGEAKAGEVKPAA